MSLINYLPEKSEYSEKFATALKDFEPNLFVIGSNARKTLYGLKTDVKDYNFLYTYEPNCTDVVNALCNHIGVTKVNVRDGFVDVDAEVFKATIRFETLDKFLFGVRFAGDGLAVRVSDGRPVTIPEYMTLPPIVEVKKIDDHGAQKNKEWVTKQLDVLTKFQDELYSLVNGQLEATPST